MPGRIVRRTTPFALLVALVAAVAGCGGGSASPPASTIAVTSTTYVTIPARTTTTTVAPPPEDTSGAGDSGDDEPEATTSDDPDRERIHEIESGDYLLGIARDYDVPINYIPEYNGWSDGLGHALVPGETLRIPPADWTPEGERGDDTTAESDGSEPDSSATECEGGEQPETYRIRAGDTPVRVAQQHGTTVSELDAANVNTQYYAGFVVGITINLPC